MSGEEHTEIYFSGDISREMYDIRFSKAIEVFNQVKAIFPWVKIDDVFAISSSTTHELLDEPVVSFVLSSAVTKALVGDQYTLAIRKFCMTSATSFIKVYPMWDDSYPSFLPEGCQVLFKGENMVEFGRSAPEGLDDFYDCYFKGDPAAIEAHFSMTERRGTYDTFHGVTIKDGAVVRKKQYIFNSQTRFADWDVMHLQLQKKKLAE